MVVLFTSPQNLLSFLFPRCMYMTCSSPDPAYYFSESYYVKFWLCCFLFRGKKRRTFWKIYFLFLVQSLYLCLQAVWVQGCCSVSWEKPKVICQRVRGNCRAGISPGMKHRKDWPLRLLMCTVTFSRTLPLRSVASQKFFVSGCLHDSCGVSSAGWFFLVLSFSFLVWWASNLILVCLRWWENKDFLYFNVDMAANSFIHSFIHTLIHSFLLHTVVCKI